MLNNIVRAREVIAIWSVSFNLTFDVNHDTVIMALAFMIIVNKKKAVT